MNEIEVKELLERHGLPFMPNRTIWATIIPSVGAYQNGLGNIMHTMKDHILHLHEQGIAILPIDDHTGKLKEDALVFLSRSNIHKTNLRIKLSKFILSIDTDEGVIEYKVRKNILACPWHKENLSILLFQE